MKRKKCRCGCRNLANPGNKYIHGHNRPRLGARLSKLTKKKIGKANLGRVHSKETREKISYASSHRSKETLLKISRASKGNNYAKGAVHSAEGRLARSIKLSGKSHYNFENGNSWNKKLHLYLSKYEFKLLKRRILERDNSACILCGDRKSKFVRMHTHHVVPAKVGCKSIFCDHESNIVSICLSCHLKIEPRNNHGNIDVINKWREFLPFAKEYLSKFGYEKLLLDDYLGENDAGR